MLVLLTPTLRGDSRRVRSNDSCSQAANASIVITVTVTGDDHFSRPSVTLLYDDLVTDSSASRVEVDAVRLCKGFNFAVLCEIGFRAVLDIVIEGEDGLSWVIDL